MGAHMALVRVYRVIECAWYRHSMSMFTLRLQQLPHNTKRVGSRSRLGISFCFSNKLIKSSKMNKQWTLLSCYDHHSEWEVCRKPCTYVCADTWWRHQMETFSALLALCVGNSLVTGKFPAQRPVTWRFGVFDLHLNKRLSKQSWGWWFETPSRSLWRHRLDTNGSHFRVFCYGQF